MDTDRFNSHLIFNAAREVVLQVAAHYGIDHVQVIFKNRQRSSHAPTGLGSLVTLGYQDLEDAAANGYEEYPSLRHLLPDQTPIGMDAARWIGLHEAAHVVANSRNKDYIRPHGREFRQAYTELISLFAQTHKDSQSET